MKRAILASGNKHKLEEIQDILKDFDFELLSMYDAGLKDFDIVEDGDTFEANSLIKAIAVQDELGDITIADDSGLMVDYLEGAPGVFSARYAGEPSNDLNNNNKLLEALDGVPTEERTARFVSVITMCFPNGNRIIARGEVEGVIGTEPVGNNGFGYDPLFVVPDYKKTFAQLNSHEKNRISHRARALELLKEKLDVYLRIQGV